MEFKFYGQSYEDLTLIVEKYNRFTDVYVCSVEDDEYDDIGWVTVSRSDVDLVAEELIATSMQYVGTSEEVDAAAA